MEVRYRTRADYEALCREAERRMRLGVPYRQVAADLQVRESTIIRWAAEHGFRQIDIESERLTGKRAPLPAYLKRAKYRRSAEMKYPEEYASRIAIAAEQQAEAARAHVAKLCEAGAALAPELDAEKAARRLMAQAVELSEAGMLVSAERAARIAERLLRADKRLGESGEAGPVDTTDYVALLRERLTYLADQIGPEEAEENAVETG